MYRKVHPSRSTVAKSNLSQTSNDINLRRVHINAQVTAMTSVLEVLYVILVILMIKLNLATFIFRGLIFLMGLYCALLPFVKSKNTSTNKDIIITRGWTNAVRHAIGIPDKYNTEVINVSSDGGKRQNQNKPPPKLLNVKKKMVKLNRTPKYSAENDISVISRLRNDILINEFNNDEMINAPFGEEPSTSYRGQSRFTNNSFGSQEEENDLLSKMELQDILSTLTNIMINSLRNEQFYIEFFKTMIEFKSETKNCRIISYSTVEHVLLQNPIIKGCSHNQYGHKVMSGITMLQLISEQYSRNEVSHTVNESPTQERLIREEILETMNFYPIDDKRSQSLFEKLIDIEEVLSEQRCE